MITLKYNNTLTNTRDQFENQIHASMSEMPHVRRKVIDTAGDSAAQTGDVNRKRRSLFSFYPA
jgi:hypothetical protein